MAYGGEVAAVDASLLGRFNIDNLLAVAGVLLIAGVKSRACAWLVVGMMIMFMVMMAVPWGVGMLLGALTGKQKRLKDGASGTIG